MLNILFVTTNNLGIAPFSVISIERMANLIMFEMYSDIRDFKALVSKKHLMIKNQHLIYEKV